MLCPTYVVYHIEHNNRSGSSKYYVLYVYYLENLGFSLKKAYACFRNEQIVVEFLQKQETCTVSC